MAFSMLSNQWTAHLPQGHIPLFTVKANGPTLFDILEEFRNTQRLPTAKEKVQTRGIEDSSLSVVGISHCTAGMLHHQEYCCHEKCLVMNAAFMTTKY